MGNSPLTSLRLSNGDHPYKVQGKSAAIDFTIDFTGRKFKQEANEETTESWEVSYTVDKSTCKLTLTKTKGKIDVKIAYDEESKNRYNSSVTVKTAKATSNNDPTATSISSVFSYRNSTTRNLTTATTAAQHDVTETKSDLYESGKTRGLMVCEWKKKCEGDKNAYMGTVTHYYADKVKDVGLSLAIKRIRVSHDGHLDFAVEGPQQHPVRALSYMFNEVHRTDTWKPAYCPHCADNIIQRLSSFFEQSESEDSDEGKAAAAILHDGRANAGALVANDGMFKGNNNGNLNIRNLIL